MSEHKVIAVFNHKGGVAKTTNTFHIGWKLAEKGKKVLLLDADPQCNLTGLILNYTGKKTYPYESQGEVLNVRDGLKPAFEARPIPITAANTQTLKKPKKLYILPGHVGLAEYESQLAIAHDLSASLTSLANIPGAFRFLIDKTASEIKADVVLIDMSPSLGAINQNLFCSSDAFIVPMAPDFFSSMALVSLSNVLPKWIQWSHKAATIDALAYADYPWTKRTPKYVGSIVQNYRVRTRDGKEAAPTKAYEKWFTDLRSTKETHLLPSLKKHGFLLPMSNYESAEQNPADFLMEVPDFNSLIAIGQDISKPVFALTQEDIKTSGSVAANQVASAKSFKKIYSDGADKIINILGL